MVCNTTQSWFIIATRVRFCSTNMAVVCWFLEGTEEHMLCAQQIVHMCQFYARQARVGIHFLSWSFSKMVCQQGVSTKMAQSILHTAAAIAVSLIETSTKNGSPKFFLRHVPKQRPLLLLQDGASAYMGPDLIDMAVENNVILLCFPPKTTHILQPCDVGIYKTMKAALKRSIQHVKLLRGHMNIEKRKVPAIIREGFLKAFTPELITTAFKACGIYPTDRCMVHQSPISQFTLN